MFTEEQEKLLKEIRSLERRASNTEYAISLYNDALAIWLTDVTGNRLFFGRFMEVFSNFPVLKR